MSLLQRKGQVSSDAGPTHIHLLSRVHEAGRPLGTPLQVAKNIHGGHQWLVFMLNTLLKGTDKSLAQLATGKQLSDWVPMRQWHLRVDRQWGKILRRREVQIGEDRDSQVSRSTPRNLPPLTPGGCVCRTRLRIYWIKRA